MIPQWIIEKKRDGLALSEEEIRAFVEGYTTGTLPDYQMAALAMAVYFRGMNADETSALTDAMMRSGILIDTSSLPVPTVDKHSTGGIGDKVSLILAPLVACCGVAVPMLSGRGLGITGGTLDKLESIPGYRVDLEAAAFLDVVRSCGCAIVGQSERLAPADRKLYALRDVTGTVPSIPLIAASIMCKKLAEGAGALVLNVTWGSGAFMKTREEAAELARVMVAIGQAQDRRMAAVLSAMEQPLGRAVGNAVEVRESLECLAGRGPRDVMDVTMALAAEMLTLTGVSADAVAAREALQAALASGAAWERFERMVALQGGDTRCLREPRRLPSAPFCRPLEAAAGGWVTRADAGEIGRAVVELGGGRRRVEDRIDPSVGLSGLVKLGESVTRGQPLATIHAADEAAWQTAAARLSAAIELAAAPVEASALLGETLR